MSGGLDLASLERKAWGLGLIGYGKYAACRRTYVLPLLEIEGEMKIQTYISRMYFRLFTSWSVFSCLAKSGLSSD